MCRCQQFGKSGVPWPSGKCMVCGDPVDFERAIISRSEQGGGKPVISPATVRRYHTDAAFHAVVHSLTDAMMTGALTEDDLRAAVDCAVVRLNTFKAEGRHVPTRAEYDEAARWRDVIDPRLTGGGNTCGESDT